MLNIPHSDAHPPVLFFEGPDYMYSNFASFAVELYGRVWQTAEHAYQSMKFTDHETKTKIFEARSAYDAKMVAKAHDAHKRADWEEVKLGVMEEIVRAKLRQHPYLQRKLKATGARLIAEDSPDDSFWGLGKDGNGANHLGRIWMRLRDELSAGTFR